MRAAWFLLGVGLFVASPVMAGPAKRPPPAPVAPAISPSQALFDRLKQQVGRWTWSHDGQSVVALDVRLSSAGSAVIETMFPGQPHEMTNIYTLNGAEVVVTHYCAGGNQPRLTAASASGDKVAFALRDATGVDPATGNYMGALTIGWQGADEISHDWQHFEAGKPAGEAKHFVFRRDKPAAK